MESRSEPRLAGARAHPCAFGWLPLQVCTTACTCERKCCLHISQPAVQSFHPESQVKRTDNWGGRSGEVASGITVWPVLHSSNAHGVRQQRPGWAHTKATAPDKEQAPKGPWSHLAPLSLLAAGPWTLQTTSDPVIFLQAPGWFRAWPCSDLKTHRRTQVTDSASRQPPAIQQHKHL